MKRDLLTKDYRAQSHTKKHIGIRMSYVFSKKHYLNKFTTKSGPIKKDIQNQYIYALNYKLSEFLLTQIQDKQLCYIQNISTVGNWLYKK